MAVVATLSKGYDLDYIWKQVDRGPAKDAASYYIQASESGGEPPGRWWGPGAKALGFEPGQRVERDPYELLFGERQAPDGSQLGRPPSGGRKAADLYAQLLGAEPHATAERKRELRTEAVRRARQSPLFFDLTISLSKSISIFHASLGENARLARQAGDQEGDAYWSALVTGVDDMIWEAVHAGFGYFQREAGYTRTGSHGTRVHGRETGQWHEADLAVAYWLQHTSRDGDMQLHVHSQIAHVARTTTDGKWRAPDSLGYNQHIGAVAAIVSQHLEEALTARFGLEWTARDDGHGFEITGISGDMMRVFSSRRESITADLRARAARFEQRYKRKPSQRELAQLAQASNFATRAVKEGALDFAQLHAGWADKLARTLGVSLASVAPSVWHSGSAGPPTRGPRDPGPAPSQLELSQATQKAIALAQQEKSTWTRADLIKYLGRVLPRSGLDPAAAAALLEDLADRALRSEFEPVACLEAPEPAEVPASLLRADGRSIYQRHGGVRYATHAQLSIEERMLALARAAGAPRMTRAHAARALGADLAQLEAALAGRAPDAQDPRGAQDTPSPRTRTGLREDQAGAALAVLTDDRRVSVINALMAADHALRRELNRRIRDDLITLGVVSGGPAVRIADGARASPGDLIICTRNDHGVEAGEPGRTLANGDLLRIEAVTAGGLLVRRALDADPATGQRRWTDRRFVFNVYRDAELGYAVTDHAAQSRTVTAGLAVITGTEDRQHNYVALSRGTEINLAYVFTHSPKTADPAPGPRPAPEIARYDHRATGPDCPPAPAATTPAEALTVLAGVLDRDGQQQSATQARSQALADVDHLAILHAIWTAETTPARDQRYRDLLMNALPPGYRREPGHQAKWLWRTLRAAELAGLDPARALADAIAERDLAGSRDIAAVLDARLRNRLGSLVPLPPQPWSEQVPALADPERRAYVAEIAALMDARKDRIGEHCAGHPRPGPLPCSGRSRLTRWTGSAGSNGPPLSAPGANCPAMTTRSTRSAPNPSRPLPTRAPPGTRPWPPSARPAARTCAACRTGGCCTCATPTPSRPPGRPGTSATSCARSAPPPGTPAWPPCAPAPRPAPPSSAATTITPGPSTSWPPATRPWSGPTGSARRCSPRRWPTAPTGRPPPAPSASSPSSPTPNSAAATPPSTSRRCAPPNPRPPHRNSATSSP